MPTTVPTPIAPILRPRFRAGARSPGSLCTLVVAASLLVTGSLLFTFVDQLPEARISFSPLYLHSIPDSICICRSGSLVAANHTAALLQECVSVLLESK